MPGPIDDILRDVERFSDLVDAGAIRLDSFQASPPEIPASGGRSVLSWLVIRDLARAPTPDLKNALRAVQVDLTGPGVIARNVPNSANRVVSPADTATFLLFARLRQVSQVIGRAVVTVNQSGSGRFVIPEALASEEAGREFAARIPLIEQGEKIRVTLRSPAGLGLDAGGIGIRLRLGMASSAGEADVDIDATLTVTVRNCLPRTNLIGWALGADLTQLADVLNLGSAEERPEEEVERILRPLILETLDRFLADLIPAGACFCGASFRSGEVEIRICPTTGNGNVFQGSGVVTA